MSDERDVLLGLQRVSTPGGNLLPTDNAGRPTAGRRLAGQVVTLTGVGNGEDALVDGQLFVWQGLTGEACECVLHFRGQYLGQTFSYNAGGQLDGVSDVGGINSGYLEIKYGVGALVNTVRIDAKPGAYQLPACDFVSVDLHIHIASGETSPQVVCAGGLAQGTYPTARPPTWTCTPRIEALETVTFLGPTNARAVDLQWQPDGGTLPDPLSAVYVQLQGYGGNSDNQIARVSLDGTDTYPAYSPVPLSDARASGTNPEWQLTVSTTSAPARPICTFFIAF
jgi:hypothetical protein